MTPQTNFRGNYFMSKFNFQNQETILLHGGQEPDPVSGSRAVPIHQTTSYVFKDTEHAQNLFGLKETGNIYTRIMNPTVDAFEQRVALLEDGVAAVATSSGMAAITLSILNIASAGDEIIADSNLYGGTYNLFLHTLPRYGIDVIFVDGTDLNAIENAITDKTKGIFAETITNPSLYVFDIESVANIAHKHGIPLIIDNTFAPAFSKPIQWGADIVVHSATKWIGGHGTTIGGVIVDGGRFNWDNGRFPEFTKPDESYAGLRYVDVGAPAFATKFRVQLLRDIGASLSPHNAFLLLQGLETLHLRIERHNENAQVVADYLKNHPAVEWVNFPGLSDHPSHDLAHKYFTEGYGSIITFGIKGGREAGRKLIDNIELWSHVANVGDAKSLIIHPASTTHQQLNDEDLEKSGVTEELVRLAVGIESTDDIIKALDQAIAKATNEPEQIKTSEQDAIKWLLQSPFDRSKEIRQKVIAVAGLDQSSIDDIKKLQHSGYHIVSIDNSLEESYKQLGDITVDIDVLFISDYHVTETNIKQLAEKQAKIIWALNGVDEQVIRAAKDVGITVISNKNLYEEALNIRSNKT